MSRLIPRHGLLLASLGVAALLVTLRVPSLIEPSWYADEGTYADIGRSLDHGAVLYRDAWDNKPPGMYWLGAAIDLISPSGHGFAEVAFLVAGVATLVVGVIGNRLGGPAARGLPALRCAGRAALPPRE